MPQELWSSRKASIIVLPSGDEGHSLLQLANEWTASWLLSPALWVLDNQIPELSDGPPQVKCWILGRDESGAPDKREVDFFRVLGSQEFELVRLLAVRTAQPEEVQKTTSSKVKLIEKYVEAGTPVQISSDENSAVGSVLKKLNLVFGSVNDAHVVSRAVIENDWDANIVAAPEDRLTPGSYDTFASKNDQYFGFVLAHIATTAGIWSGLPTSTYELGASHVTRGSARLQRVFVRVVATDKLSGDLAKWALEKAASPDNENGLGKVSGSEVASIHEGLISKKSDELVEFMLKGNQYGNLLYQDLADDRWAPEQRRSLFKRLGIRVKDFIEGLLYLPKWSLEMITQKIDQDVHEEIPRGYLPSRLDPRFDLVQAENIINQPPPKVGTTSPEFWKFIRENISSAIDSPPEYAIPSALVAETGERLIFGDTRIVLPNPDEKWEESELSVSAEIHLDPVTWLDVQGAQERKEQLAKKKAELAPGMDAAREEMKETKDELAKALEEEVSSHANLELAEHELQQDLILAQEMRDEHTHGMPPEIVGPNRPNLDVEESVFEGEDSGTDSNVKPSEVEGSTSVESSEDKTELNPIESSEDE